MTRDEVIALARESGWCGPVAISDMVRFAETVAACEREACAQVCDELGRSEYLDDADNCATAIRARSEQDKGGDHDPA